MLELGISFPLLFTHRDDHCPDEGGGEQDADDFQGQDIAGHQLVADLANSGGGHGRGFARNSFAGQDHSGQDGEHDHGYAESDEPA